MLKVDPHTGTGNQNNWFVLWALVAVFALPVVCSWTLILNPGLLPARYSNHGVLIQPSVGLPAVTVHRMDGTAFRLAELHGKWTFLMVVDATCPESCKQFVYLLQQIRRATGKDMTHVELLVLYNTNPAQGDLSMVKESPGMLVAGFNDSGVDILLASALQQAGVYEHPGLIVVDPMGNMVMHYPHEVSGKDILQDLRKLLRATHDWLPDMPEKPDGFV